MKGCEADTIAAIATPLGEGGVGVIRISGHLSSPILKKICKIKHLPKSHRACHSWVYVSKNVSPSYAEIVSRETISATEDRRETFLADEVIYTYYKAPKSYTGEDVVEISCHGGIAITLAVLNEAVSCGARIAERGEFTKRAFLNGKLDLAQTEAVLALIKAKNKIFVEKAAYQLKGNLSERINNFYESVLKIIASLEAWIDFSDDVVEPKRAKLGRHMKALINEIDQMLQTAEVGRILRHGIKAVIIGSPNVGKSSLLNALAGEERAIVSHIPGTTRDVIQESINLGQMVLNLSDTAGLGRAECEIEMEGIARAKAEIEKSELIFFVADASRALNSAEMRILKKIDETKKVVILNKIDLLGDRKAVPERELKKKRIPFVKTCLLDGRGLKELREGIGRLFIGGEKIYETGTILFNSRHKECLQRASEALHRALVSIEGRQPFDMAVIELREAAGALGGVTGKTVTENVLDRIFNEFCVGK